MLSMMNRKCSLLTGVSSNTMKGASSLRMQVSPSSSSKSIAMFQKLSSCTCCLSSLLDSVICSTSSLSFDSCLWML